MNTFTQLNAPHLVTSCREQCYLVNLISLSELWSTGILMSSPSQDKIRRTLFDITWIFYHRKR